MFILLEEIIFIERFDWKFVIYIKNGKFEINEVLISLEGVVDFRFMIFYRFYIINVEFLIRIEVMG